ncbi:MAG: DUF1624 domain-containing protein [Candidatus Diapherotrites archaeon]|nr:DUF1624 domain-containing protein [Candidatus Diapherotrites archaeon]
MNKRLKSADIFKGLAVFLMVVFNWTSFYPNIPSFFQHSWGQNALTIIDLIAPMFIFATGFLVTLSFARRIKTQKTGEIRKYYLKKYGKLFLIGIVLDAIVSFALFFTFGILESIAFGALFALVLVGTSKKIRLGVIIAIAALHSFLLGFSYYTQITGILPHGSINGFFAWATIAVCGSIVASFSIENKKFYRNSIGIAAVLLGLGLALSIVFPIDRILVSGSYVLISQALCTIILVSFVWLFDQKQKNFGFLKNFGQNSLFVFILQYPVLFVLRSAELKNFLDFYSGLLAAIIIAIIVFYINKAMNKKGIRLTF